VDCGFGLVMLSFWPTIRLSSVDFPTFGFPTTVTIPALGILEVSPFERELLIVVGLNIERPGIVN